MFCCEDCKYKSNRKFNLQKHIRNVHKRDATDSELTREQITSSEEQITSIEERITSFEEQITSFEERITSFEEQITSELRQNISPCPKCLKKFKSFRGFKKHQKICKGVSNALECHFCHHIFATQQSKSKHLKICQIKQVQELVETHVINNHNINNNNNSNNSNTQYNNLTNNYIIHNYNSYTHRNGVGNDFEKHIDVSNLNDFGQEDISYIDDETMTRIALNYDLKEFICLKHFNPEHPENHNILANCSKSYKVFKNNKWNIESKECVHSMIYQNAKITTFQFVYAKIVFKMLGEKESYEYLGMWQDMENTCKKKINRFTEAKIRELTKNKKKYVINDTIVCIESV